MTPALKGIGSYESEAEDLVQKAEEFSEIVKSWIQRHHPQYGF